MDLSFQLRDSPIHLIDLRVQKLYLIFADRWFRLDLSRLTLGWRPDCWTFGTWGLAGALDFEVLHEFLPGSLLGEDQAKGLR